MGRKILVYPYNDRSYALIKSLLLDNNDITICTLIGTGLIGKDAGFAVNRKDLGISVSEYNHNLLEQIDCLFITGGRISDPIHSETLQVIEEALAKESLEVYSTVDFENREYQLFKSPKFIQPHKIQYDINMNEGLVYYHTQIPVIIVGGMFETYELSCIPLLLKKSLDEKGYNAAILSNDPTTTLVGTVPFPEEFVNSSRSIEYRIMLLNQYIKRMCSYHKPDVIIIQIPDGVMRFSDKFPNSFGSYAYMISESVSSDYMIYSTPEGIIDLKEISILTEYLRSKFDFSVETIHLNNCVINVQALTYQTPKIEVVYRDKLFCKDIIKDNHIYEGLLIGDVLDDNFVKTVCDDIICKL